MSAAYFRAPAVCSTCSKTISAPDMGFALLAHAKFLTCLLSLLSLVGCFAVAYVDEPKLSKSDHEAVGSSEDMRLHVFTLDYDYVQIPYEVTLWILLASLAKIGKWKSGSWVLLPWQEVKSAPCNYISSMSFCSWVCFYSFCPQKIRCVHYHDNGI